VILSLVLFFGDHYFHYFDALHSKLSFVTLPVQYVANLPLNLTNKLVLSFVKKNHILKENERLTSELLLVKSGLQRLDFLEHENAELRALLHSSKQIKYKYLPVEVIMSEVDNYGQTITLNKGKQDGVYVGQPVVDPYGLVGQIILVEGEYSRVLLITHHKSAVPVMVVRSGLQAIALGKGVNDYLELANVSETADIKVGDILVTSGLGQRFPGGYQVGVVKEIKYMIGERFVKVYVVPSAYVAREVNVLLIWPELTGKQIQKK